MSVTGRYIRSDQRIPGFNGDATAANTFSADISAFYRGEEKFYNNFNGRWRAGAAIQNILLTAVDLGYGACWMSAPMVAKDGLESLIEVEEPYHLIAFVAVGVPAKNMKPKEKKPLDQIFKLID